MGDVTSVELSVRLADNDRVQVLIDKKGSDELIDDGSSTGHVGWRFCDVNYAELGFENTLQDLLIPYDKFWESGCGYPAGEEIFRINADGEPELKKFAEGMRGMVSLNDVKSALADGTLPAYLAQAEEDASYISWEDQEIILTNLKAKEEKTDG